MVALVSMAYNGGSGIIGPKLKKALEENDRINAWYEIRFQSNGDKYRGLQDRRKDESESFGLFKDPKNITQDEAIKAIKFFDSKKDEIEKYLKEMKGFGKDKKGKESQMLYIKQELNKLNEQLKPAKDLLAQQYLKDELKFDDKNKEDKKLEEIIKKHIEDNKEQFATPQQDNPKKGNIMDSNLSNLQGQEATTTLIKENIPKKAQEEFLRREDLQENEKNIFGKLFDNVSDKVKSLTEKKLDLNNLMGAVKDNAMQAILDSNFIKVLLAMFGVKEERFKELFQGLFDKVGGFDQAMNNSFGFGMNASNAQQIDFSNFIWKGDTAGCRQFCDGEMSLNQRGYNRLLGMVQQGKMSQEMFNYCCNRNPIRQDMNEFYADMKAGLGEGVANIMMQMAKAESGLGKNIMNKEAAGAAGELQLIRSNAIAFGKKVWGAGHSDVEILKRYDEDPKFRNQVAIEFCKEQLKALRPPTAEGIRAVWFLGVGGGPKFLRAYHSNPNMSVANIFDEQVMKQNGMNASWTLRDCYNKFIAAAGFGSSQRLDINIPSQNYANNQHYNEEQSVGQKA